jgi:hypothetical protein
LLSNSQYSYLIEFSNISLEKLNIQQAFNAAAADYDKLRRTLIPCFDDFYKTAVEVIPAEGTAPLKVLDLGAGYRTLFSPRSSSLPKRRLHPAGLSR